MTKKTLKIAALMLASTTMISSADAGGVRLQFGGPLGSFVAHPNHSSGPGGTARKQHYAKSYDKPSYGKPSYVGRKQHDEDEAPVRKAKKIAPKVEVAEEAPAARKIRKPKIVIDKPETAESPVEVKTAKVEDKTTITDATPSIFVPDAPPARTEEILGTQSTNPATRTAALTPASEPAETVKTEDVKAEEPAADKDEPKNAEAKAESTAAKICRKFSAVIAGLVEIPCGN